MNHDDRGGVAKTEPSYFTPLYVVVVVVVVDDCAEMRLARSTFRRKIPFAHLIFYRFHVATRDGF